MSRGVTGNLNLPVWDDGDNPGAGSKTVMSTGLNGSNIILDAAVGVGHNADGTHKAAVIDKANLKTTAADGSTIELDASVGLRAKDGGISAVKLATDAVETLKIKDANVTAAKLATDAVETTKIKNAAVTTEKVLDKNITSEKLEYVELVASLSQALTNDPALNIVNNTIVGTISCTRDGNGQYRITAAVAGTFITGRTIAILGSVTGFAYTSLYSETVIKVFTSNTSYAPSDDILNGTCIMIRVYPPLS